jgi:Fe-S-cluster-containing hydrogenase component 2/CRP-like cAMP-binding protein/thioredoxin reductase
VPRGRHKGLVISDRFRIAIVGSGPAGLSAAGRAAARDRAEGLTAPSYVLLEGFAEHARTIQRYQKGKHVMAEPGYLDLRSDLEFDAGTREAVLDRWALGIDTLAINIRNGAEVTSIAGHRGDFTLTLKSAETIAAEYVVLALGLEGSPRKLGVPGDDLPGVDYHLDDPAAFQGQTIVVVGAGDSAIENALGLAARNRVYIVNRRDEFSRAKEGNLNAVLRAISDPDQDFHCVYNAAAIEVEATPDRPTPLRLRLDTPEGARDIDCHRIIARLGGVPPRRFVESAGVEFPNDRPDAIPALSRTYESNIPGLYIVGSLAGYPLIKQAMNQGFDVVEFIHGHDIEPADHPLLADRFLLLPFERTPSDVLDLFQHRIPFFATLNALQFRELIIDSEVLVSYPEGDLLDDAVTRRRQRLDAAAGGREPRITRVIREGDYLYRQGDYATSFFTIVEGEVHLESDDPLQSTESLGRGQFFGEGSLISGRPRQESARAGRNCILVETPRRIMVKLFNSNEDVRSGVDWIFVVRELKRIFAPGASFAELRPISEHARIHQFRAGDMLFEAGDSGDSLHVIRRGSVSLRRVGTAGEVTVAEVRAGELVGEMALMGDPIRRDTAVATVATETVEIGRTEFLGLMNLASANLAGLQSRARHRLVDNTQMEVRPESSGAMSFLLAEGLGEATDTLLIDESLCIGCDNCERACAETHGGLSRLDRAAGKSFAHIHVPIACRHCEHPHCMKDCPPNAIQRSADGQVYIDDSCIGCGNCQTNCPYDVIRMSYEAPPKPALLSWLLFGRGPGPGEAVSFEPTTQARDKGKKAVKCDACLNDPRGYACVRACPTGAAQRVNPEQFIQLLKSDVR